VPTRLVREGILTSERISKLTPGAELFYRKLLNVADDHGRFEASTPVLRARCYPRQLEQTTEAMVSDWLAECKRLRLLRVYRVQGTEYLEIDKFNQRIRYGSRFPGPDGKVPRRATVIGRKRNNRQKSGLSLSVVRLKSGESPPEVEAKPEPNAESYAEHTDDSAAVSGGGGVEGEILGRAGKAPANGTRPKPSAGATPALSGGRGKKRKTPNKNGDSEHTAAELAVFREAVRDELGPDASEAEVERRFAEYIAPRRDA
jgi:hypothetical protein